MFRWVDVERVPVTDQYPVDIYRPKGAVPDGWFWLGHSADANQGLIVKPTLPPKSTRNYAVTTGQAGSGRSHQYQLGWVQSDDRFAGFTVQPFPVQPQYAFLSSFFGAPFSAVVAPGSDFGALRPGLFLEGQLELVSRRSPCECHKC